MELKEKSMTSNVPYCEAPNENHPETQKVMLILYLCMYLVCLLDLGFFSVLGRRTAVISSQFPTTCAQKSEDL